MSMNSNYGCDCGYDPCQCHTTCATPVACIPVPPSKPTNPNISVEGILRLIEAKCDKETCAMHQLEIAFLYTLLGVDKPAKPGKPTQPIPPGTGGGLPTDPKLAFQLISNMVDSLKGDLKGKYPSAELIKKELMAIWKCLADKQVHHGDWKDNFTWRDVVTDDMQCYMEDGKDVAPKRIKVRTPVNAGSTVFYTNKQGKTCLYESLVMNNTTEPTMLNVVDGLWLNYCDLREAINCLMPRTKITDCKEKCDDPNQDGVHEGKKLCDRVADIEAYIKAHP